MKSLFTRAQTTRLITIHSTPRSPPSPSRRSRIRIPSPLHPNHQHQQRSITVTTTSRSSSSIEMTNYYPTPTASSDGSPSVQASTQPGPLDSQETHDRSAANQARASAKSSPAARAATTTTTAPSAAATGLTSHLKEADADAAQRRDSSFIPSDELADGAQADPVIAAVAGPETANGAHHDIATTDKLQALPAPYPANSSRTTTLEVDGKAIRLDHLGPLVVHKDGTMSRISNWEQMAEIERQNTLRILGKRNQLRLDVLRQGTSEDTKTS